MLILCKRQRYFVIVDAAMNILCRNARFVIFLAIIVFLSASAISRNPVWKNRLTLWKDVAQKSPEKARGHHNLGNAYTAFNMYDDAIKEYHAAIDIEPDSFYGNTYSALGLAFLKKGMSEKAYKAFQIALEINPHSGRPHYGIGMIYEKKGDFNEAIREYKFAILNEPYYVEPYVALGIIYGNMDMLIEARNALEMAVNLRHEIAYPHYNLAVTYDKLGDDATAIFHYKEFLRLVSKDDKSLPLDFSRKRIAELEGYTRNR